VDSTGHKVSVDSEITSENWVVADSETINDTASLANTWIPQRTQSYLTRKSSSKTESLPPRELTPKLLPQLTLGFIYANSPSWLCIVPENWVANNSEIITETASIADSWICQGPQSQLTQKSQAKTESLPTQKAAMRLLPQLTRGFVSAKRPSWLPNRKRKLSRCRLRNNQWQCFQGWHMDSTGHKVPVDSEITSENWVAADS